MGCHFSQKFQDREEDKNEAEEVTAKLFDYLKSGEFEKATLLFDDDFYKVTSKEELLGIFTNTQDHLGKLENTTLTKWNTVVSEGTIESGSYVLDYASEFTEGNAIQKISLRKVDNQPIKIIGYTLQVDSL